MAKLILFVAVIAAAIWWFSRSKSAAMTEREARAVLGVGDEADAETIRAAHRRLVAAVHPDKGGSAELTQRLNVARDVLLKRLG